MQAPKSEGGNFERHPVGWCLAVCTRVVDKGTHWNDRKQKYERKLMIAFESAKLMSTGDYANEPFLLFANFNYSMYASSHLCKFIEDWSGRRFPTQEEADIFDLATLIGKKAFCNVVHSEDGKFTNIQTIGPVPDGMIAPDIKGKTILIDQDKLIQSEVDKLTENMKASVLSAKEQTEPEKPLTQGAEAQSTILTSPSTMNSGKTDALRGAIESENPAEGMDDTVPF